jgi:peptidoglycan/xylan/chitin deacetylase (PgdA/CDA1 family)
MTDFSLSLQTKALTSMIATLAVAGSVVWQWRDQPMDLKVPARAPALPLSAFVETLSPKHSKHVRTIVVRTASNLRTDADGDALVRNLLKADVRRVWVQFKQDESDEFIGGEVFYPSKIAPVADGFAQGRLLRFVQSLHQAGIEVAVWLPAFHDPSAWKAHADWRAHHINEDGTTSEQKDWLCPRNPGAIKYEASLLAEVVALCKDELAGIYTDFIRYDNDYSCACPRCLGELAQRRQVDAIKPIDIRKALHGDAPLWLAWTNQRADAIHDALDAMRDALSEHTPDIWFGASVLPFSALDYNMNTQSGQNLAKMCLAGIDEIVLMGYWDDWENSPEWLSQCIEHAQELVGDDARLSCFIDADMSVRRTMRTLDAVLPTECDLVWFNYEAWTLQRFGALHRACAQRDKFNGTPKAPFTAVTLRIDTEPDADHRYDTVKPEMIAQLVTLFEQEQIKATFVTCGTMAKRQPEAIKTAQAAGHEIAGHAHDHEQIDGLPESAQALVIDRMARAFHDIGIQLDGFGAPRNSITDLARDRLIEQGYFYDGSDAFDPMVSYLDPQIVAHSQHPESGIVLVPFIIPNDYDARVVQKLTAAQMLDAWVKRLDIIATLGESCFVLDVHQWLITEPDNYEALRQFIRTVKARDDCRILTLRDTAKHVLAELRRVEGALTARP